MSIKTQKHLEGLRAMSAEQLRKELVRLQLQQFENRMQLRSGQMSRHHLLGVARRDIARIKTLLRQRAGAEGSS